MILTLCLWRASEPEPAVEAAQAEADADTANAESDRNTEDNEDDDDTAAERKRQRKAAKKLEKQLKKQQKAALKAAASATDRSRASASASASTKVGKVPAAIREETENGEAESGADHTLTPNGKTKRKGIPSSDRLFPDKRIAQEAAAFQAKIKPKATATNSKAKAAVKGASRGTGPKGRGSAEVSSAPGLLESGSCMLFAIRGETCAIS